MNLLLVVVLGFFSFVGQTLACSEDGSTGFLPKNNLNIPAHIKTNGGITETAFNDVIDGVYNVYYPIVKQIGGDLYIDRKWNDGTVNAFAELKGSLRKVSMFGGLARHEAITADGFALVVCHEIGHHLGGAPKKVARSWSSSEGQSDYFATLKCLRKVWNNDDNMKIVSKMTVPKFLNESCGRKFVWNADVAMCVRSGMAGMSVAQLFKSLSNSAVEVTFETPDTRAVTITDDNHPAYQCRLDTFFQGALCEKSFNEDVSDNDEVRGTCHAKTGHKVGLRPKCWFKARE